MRQIVNLVGRTNSVISIVAGLLWVNLSMPEKVVSLPSLTVTEECPSHLCIYVYILFRNLTTLRKKNRFKLFLSLGQKEIEFITFFPTIE